MKKILLGFIFLGLFFASSSPVLAIPEVIGRIVTPNGVPVPIDMSNQLKVQWSSQNNDPAGLHDYAGQLVTRTIPESTYDPYYAQGAAKWRNDPIPGLPAETNGWYYWFPVDWRYNCASTENTIKALQTSGYNCNFSGPVNFTFANTPQYLVMPDIICNPNTAPTPTPAYPTPTSKPLGSGEPPYFNCSSIGMNLIFNFGPAQLNASTTDWQKTFPFTVPSGMSSLGKAFIFQGEGHNWDLACRIGPANDAGAFQCDQGEADEKASVFLNSFDIGDMVDHNPDDDRNYSYEWNINNLTTGSNTVYMSMDDRKPGTVFVKGTICGLPAGGVLPTPIPPCSPSVTLNPSSTNLDVGSSQIFTASYSNTAGCGALTTTFINSNSSAASMTTNATQATLTGLNTGTTYLTANLYDNGVLKSSKVAPVNVICNPPNAPSNFNAVDDVFKIKTTWRDNSTNETGYELKKDGVVIANLPANSVIYTDGPLAGLCTVAHSYELTAVNTTSSIACQRSTTVSAIGKCEDYKAWFGVQDGGVAASNGEVRSDLPSWAGPVAYGTFPPTFVSDSSAPSLLPGMVFGPSYSGFDANQSNNQQWLVSGYTGWTETTTKRENTFRSMEDRILARVNPEAVGTTTFTSQGGLDSLVGQSADNLLNLPGGQVQVVQIAGDLTFDTDINVGPKKLLIFVEGNVQINNNISVGSGGFLAVLASGNTTISPTVGDSGTTVDALTGYTLNTTTDSRLASYPAHIEGIFYADGVIDTGGRDNSLSPQRHRFIKIEGSLIGMTNVNLKRDVRGPYPAEYVKFRPDFSYILHQIGLRRKTFQEMLAP